MLFGTDIFDENRYGKVTGSRCSPLVPLRDAQKGMDTLAKELASERYFRHYDEVGTWQTEHGNLCEQLAFEHYQKYYDKDIQEGKWIESGDYGGTIDAMGVDFKCPTSLGAWLSYLHEGINSQQYNQCQLYMKLTGLDSWKIAAFLMETQRMSDNGLSYPVDIEKRMIIVDVAMDSEWNEKFDTNLPKVIGSRDKYFDVLVSEFGQPKWQK